MVSEVRGGEYPLEKRYGYNAEKYVTERFDYDVMGNPTVYRDRTLEWQGRRLVKYTKDTKSATYTYDFNGVRTSKTLSDGKRTDFVVNYIYDGNNLIAEQRGTKWITYFYGVDGVAGFEYDNNTYLYRKNVQGDVTHIYKKLNDGKLELVAQYVYDAWGNHKAFNAEGVEVQSTEKVIANMNPFRYRSYYFDVETQLYYLQTRYYDAVIGRFISADSIEYLDPETLGGLNLYAYCGNNPVMGIDPSGKFILSTAVIVAALIAGAIAGAFYGGITAHENGQNVLAGILVGAVSGALMSLGAAFAGAFIAPVLAGTVTGLTAIGSIAIGTTIAFGSGFLVGASAEATLQAINNNGKVVDVGAVLWSGLEWGILNVQNAFTSSTAGELLGFVNNFAIGLANNFLTGAIGLLIDLLRNPKFRGEYNYKKVVKGAAV